MTVADALDKLYQLQVIDRGIKTYEAELTKLPQNLAVAEEELKGVEGQVAEAKSRVDAILKRRRELEGEIESVGQQIIKYETQKISVKTNQEFHAINKEIEHSKNQRSGLEDRVLESFDEEEAAATRLGQVQAKLEEVKKTVASRKQELETRSAEDKKLLTDLRGQREALVPGIDSKILARYTAIAARKNGVAVAVVHGASCGACHSTLPPQTPHEVRKREKVIACEFCGVFLVPDPAVDGVG